MSTRKTYAPGWIRRRPGTSEIYRGKYPLLVPVRMTEDMVAFLDTHAMELQERMDTKSITRAALVREAIADVAWNYFQVDLDED